MALLAQFQRRSGRRRRPASSRHQHLLLLGCLLRHGFRCLIFSQQRIQIRHGSHSKLNSGRRCGYRNGCRHDDPSLRRDDCRIRCRNHLRPGLPIPDCNNIIDSFINSKFEHGFLLFSRRLIEDWESTILAVFTIFTACRASLPDLLELLWRPLHLKRSTTTGFIFTFLYDILLALD